MEYNTSYTKHGMIQERYQQEVTTTGYASEFRSYRIKQ